MSIDMERFNYTYVNSICKELTKAEKELTACNVYPIWKGLTLSKIELGEK